MGTWVRSSTLADAKRVHRTLARQWRYHCKVCHQCLVTSAVRDRYCEDGWDLVKRLNLARDDLALLTAPPCGEQGELF